MPRLTHISIYGQDVALPEGEWRQLSPGEIRQSGDMYWSTTRHGWKASIFGGRPVPRAGLIAIRRISNDVNDVIEVVPVVSVSEALMPHISINGDAVLLPEGDWRALTHGEVIKAGDMLYGSTGRWHVTTFVGRRVGDEPCRYTYIRRIDVPTPTVSPQDYQEQIRQHLGRLSI